MGHITFDMFIGAHHDYEASQYRILGGLRTIRDEFHRNRIYPALAELIELHNVLEHVCEQKRTLRDDAPRRIKGLDLKNKRVILESLDLGDGDIEAISDLILWSLPRIREAIEEGKTIYNFVDEHLTVTRVGILPSYVEEGYVLVPEATAGLLHALRYEVTIFTSSDHRYRNLKTSIVRTFPLTAIGQSPVSIKMELVAGLRDLPNPATYAFTTDIEFPFTETLLPVAKRRLLRTIYS